MKVGFTGTRQGMTKVQRDVIQATLEKFKSKWWSTKPHYVEVHHGDCIGADEEFHNIARDLGLYIVAHPPNNSSLRANCDADEICKPKPYLVRNKDIVSECDYIIAAPQGYVEVKRGSGTWATIRMARASHTPHGIIYPGTKAGSH